MGHVTQLVCTFGVFKGDIQDLKFSTPSYNMCVYKYVLNININIPC